MRRTRVALVALLLLLLALVSACGSDDEGSTDDSSSQGDAGDAVDAGDSGDSGDGGDGAAVPEDLCALLSADDLSTALGTTVTTETGPSGDCEFDEEDVRGLSGSVGVIQGAGGGYDAYVSGINGTITDPETTDLDGIGERGVVASGLPAYGGSENLTAAGVAAKGDLLLTVTLVQSRQMSAEELSTAAQGALRLLDSSLS